MTYLGEGINEYMVTVAKFICDDCGDLFTVCPPPDKTRIHVWNKCLAYECPSYDANRDADRLFDDMPELIVRIPNQL
jgi:hypothetical protein